MHDGQVCPRRQCSLQSRKLGGDALDRLDDVNTRLALYIDDDSRYALVLRSDLLVLEPIDDVGNVVEQNRRPVSISNDDLLIGRCGGELIISLDTVDCCAPSSEPLGPATFALPMASRRSSSERP
jgi:hypothetical protein